MVGLEINSRYITMVALAESRVKAACRTLSPPDSVAGGAVVNLKQVAATIGQLAWRVRANGPVAIAVPRALNKWVDAPRISLDELNAAAPFEGPKRLPNAAEPMTYRFSVPPEAYETEDKNVPLPARLVAAPRSVIDGRLDAALLAGLVPVVAAPESDAVVAALTRNQATDSILWKGKATAAINLQAEYIEMTVARETRLEFTRTLNHGTDQLIDTIGRFVGADTNEAVALLREATIDDAGLLQFPTELGLPPISALQFLHELTAEMRRLADFQRSRFPDGSYLGLLDAFVLTGEGASIRGLERYCSASLGVTCLPGDLEAAFDWPKSLKEDDLNPYCPALGAAIIACQEAIAA